ncbi:MAG: copper amine oxidase N-terminal domain-containing protein [Clostridiales bacterium]|nr:copper amine oxidase N-terminal domain-containing protein [Clostridiales bacterium]
MKKKLLILVALAATLLALVIPSANAFAASDNRITSQPQGVPLKTLFINSGGGITSREATNGGTDDIKYILSAPELVIELKEDLPLESIIRLTLTNAKWFFRDQQSDDGLTDNLLGGGVTATYDSAEGSWTPESGEKSAGTYVRAGIPPNDDKSIKTANLKYKLSISAVNDAQATVTFADGGNKGDIIRIPLVVRTLSEGEFLVAIESGFSTITSSTLCFGSTGAIGIANEHENEQKAETPVQSALESQVVKAIKENKTVVFELPDEIDRYETPRGVWKLLSEAGKAFKVSRGNVTITIPGDIYKNDAVKNASEIVAVIANSSVTAAPESEKLIAFDAKNADFFKNAYEVGLYADGEPVKFGGSPLSVLVSFDTAKYTEHELQSLTFYIDGGSRVAGRLEGASYVLGADVTGVYYAVIAPNAVSIKLAVGEKAYMINSVPKALDVAPIIRGERTLVPVRFIAEAFGAGVLWNDRSKYAVINFGDRELTLTEGVNLPNMDVSPIIIDERFFVPIRYIAESFGSEVKWDAINKTVEINQRLG